MTEAEIREKVAAAFALVAQGANEKAATALFGELVGQLLADVHAIAEAARKTTSPSP